MIQLWRSWRRRYALPRAKFLLKVNLECGRRQHINKNWIQMECLLKTTLKLWHFEARM